MAFNHSFNKCYLTSYYVQGALRARRQSTCLHGDSSFFCGIWPSVNSTRQCGDDTVVTQAEEEKVFLAQEWLRMLLRRIQGHFSGTSEQRVTQAGGKERGRIPSGSHKGRKLLCIFRLWLAFPACWVIQERISKKVGLGCLIIGLECQLQQWAIEGKQRED